MHAIIQGTHILSSRPLLTRKRTHNLPARKVTIGQYMYNHQQFGHGYVNRFKGFKRNMVILEITFCNTSPLVHIAAGLAFFIGNGTTLEGFRVRLVRPLFNPNLTATVTG
ncbi:hypothetical protein CYLTODRAFT_460697 [Cylindrobasidium torrendii FP15055 ss-10]|uniref:Uncharacterized protein n=1 Tax=Cylindrobasidium torrendii FP15055 ss-10 TaxID=1314674 RepID=A0A0D7ARV0_9AGAR|nr:hypothetical protein CYLTODRAFT_460697 [Cylindrobasidium torrendii FP15055 ss-10]